MFKNRSINIIVVLSIAALAVLTLGTVFFTQQTPSSVAALDWYFSHDHAIVTEESYVVTTERVVSAEYMAMKDRQLDQEQVAPAKDSSVDVSAIDLYAAWQLYQEGSVTALPHQFEIAVTGPAESIHAERYANLKDAQLARSDLGVAISAGRARYMNLKEAQLERPDSNRIVPPINDPYVSSLNPGLSNER